MTRYCKNCNHKKTDHKTKCIGNTARSFIGGDYKNWCTGLAINKNRYDFKCYCEKFKE